MSALLGTAVTASAFQALNLVLRRILLQYIFKHNAVCRHAQGPAGLCLFWTSRRRRVIVGVAVALCHALVSTGLVCRCLHGLRTAAWQGSRDSVAPLAGWDERAQGATELVLTPVPGIQAAAVVSVAYFLFDLWDMPQYGGLTLDMLAHHVGSGAGLLVTLLTGRYHKFALFSLTAEFNTVFLHVRTLLNTHVRSAHVSGAPRWLQRLAYTNWVCALASLLLCRGVVHMYALYQSLRLWQYGDEQWLPVARFGSCAGLALMTLNCTLFIRLLRAGALPRLRAK